MLRKFSIVFIFFIGGLIPNFAQQLAQRKDSAFRMLQYSVSEMFRIDSSAYDSSLTRLPYLNPYMPDENFYTYCTRSGNPYISNIISERILPGSYFFPQSAFGDLIQNKQNSDYYYLTNVPFTSATYKFQGIVQSKEELVDVIFARRVSRTSHIGFSYRLFSNRSETDFQRANDHSMYMYWVTPGKSYFHLSQFYYNTFEFKENGGIAADSLINYASSDFYGTQVRIDNATSKLVHWGLHSTHQWYFKKLFGAEEDSTNSGGLVYRFSLESNKKLYSEGNPNSSFYSHYYSRRGSLTDSLLLWQFTNLIQLNAPVLSRYLPDLRASLSHTYYESFHGANIDTIAFSVPSHSWQNYSQVWLQGEVGYHFPIFTALVNWKSCLVGYGWGDQQLRGLMRFKGTADSASYIQLNLLSKSQTPSFLLKSIFLNHYIWNKGDSLDREYVQQVGGELYVRPLQVKMGVNYYLLKNYLYFDNYGLNQTREWQHLLVVTGNHLLKVGGFSLQSKVWLQFFDEKYLHLPHWGIFQTAAYGHTFAFSTGGRLFVRLGVDFKYYSQYLPDTYLPPLGVFALTSKDALDVTYAGDYPIFNVHLTIKVKNVSFYVKYGHFNAWWNARTFVAAHYPMLPATLSYGINWMFYDW